ncbi:MAG TPA: redoxin domain-containing protein, partial [bacterium]|nr:redoxin domain-containing protein [bacterium]
AMALMDVYNEHRIKAAGTFAPDFALPDQEENEVSLSQLMNEGMVLLYFYSHDGHPGVDAELKDLNASYKKFRQMGIVPVAVSSDDVATHKKYAEENDIMIPLLADPDYAVARAYGTYNSSGVNSRASFIISSDQEIVRVYTEQRMRPHVRELYVNVKETLLD